MWTAFVDGGAEPSSDRQDTTARGPSGPSRGAQPQWIAMGGGGDSDPSRTNTATAVHTERQDVSGGYRHQEPFSGAPSIAAGSPPLSRKPSQSMHQTQQPMPKPRVEVFVKPACPACAQVQAELDKSRGKVDLSFLRTDNKANKRIAWKHLISTGISYGGKIRIDGKVLSRGNPPKACTRRSSRCRNLESRSL
uniref:Glutaredoxin domain-containing protein n=1 Tax=Chromera velia CCMP2878 TaxID=1169474 RepID=A0A0G4HP87_9ALVE|eukprot:Cvel_1219.t1-p1 / transcript=Cvel_1219.t1 / gene=Cvel_1219 / organism=Chromera_velia_CCMP2878 / gene_product=hypothetical protein / transcript_product=hypothetical protein / location=Cvel_scaffold40:144557-145132(-) / protein_length=192 / sequence_SO=supercontig / SO=protein_coding / is_pseudo=false